MMWKLEIVSVRDGTRGDGCLQCCGGMPSIHHTSQLECVVPVGAPANLDMTGSPHHDEMQFHPLGYFVNNKLREVCIVETKQLMD